MRAPPVRIVIVVNICRGVEARLCDEREREVLETSLRDKKGFLPFVLRDPRGGWKRRGKSWEGQPWREGRRERASSRGGGEVPESNNERFWCFVFTLILPCSFS